jgi:streptogramin lyase
LAGCGDNDGRDASLAETTTSAPQMNETIENGTAAKGVELRLGDRDALRIELPSPDWLAADASHVYVKLDGGEVEQLDPATGAVVASAEIAGDRGVSGSGCQGIGAGFDSVWSCYGSDVVRFSLDPFEEVSRIPAGKAASQGHLATGLGRVWVLQGDGSTLVGIDPETEELGEPIPLPVRGSDLAVGDDAVWVVSSLDDAVLVVDPASGAVRHRIDANGPTTLSVSGDAVWVGGSDAVHRIEQSLGTVSSTFAGGPGPSGALAADDSGFWVRRGNDVRHVDAASGAETESFSLDLSEKSPGDMLRAFGTLWTTGSEDAALFRIALD